jgi:5-(carboxyamino)imidazole ribonucleotide mutase
MTQSKSSKPLVGILMGSDSDWPIMKATAEALSEFGIVSEARVISAHRTPRDLEAYASSAGQRRPRRR